MKIKDTGKANVEEGNPSAPLLVDVMEERNLRRKRRVKVFHGDAIPFISDSDGEVDTDYYVYQQDRSEKADSIFG